MLIQQISVFVENKRGRLCEVTKLLADHKIDIRAISIADTVDYGILRLIVDDPGKAREALRAGGYTFTLTDVLGVGVPDSPGGLNLAVETLDRAGVAVEYVYAFLNPQKETAFVILRVSDNEAAARILRENGVHLMTNDEITAL